jgi:CDP-diacylglycerol--glycerol-3-phosphate 3-phosphatidyltransferase
MLDPIADKAMVVIALLIIVGYSSMSPWLVLPATIIVFREVFVLGLREFLGDTAGTLKVTKLAKWKTSAQMVAIATLFSQGIFEHHFALSISSLENSNEGQQLALKIDGASRLWWSFRGMVWSSYIGLWLLWIAAGLTLITGLDYFVKALPYLRDEK